MSKVNLLNYFITNSKRLRIGMFKYKIVVKLVRFLSQILSYETNFT